MPSLASHLRYARYLIRHKWFVFVECAKLGIPIQGLLHDWSKFRPTEWNPYVRYFYGEQPSPRDKTGAYDPLKVGEDFDFAWLSHQHLNPHHHQHWVLRGDDGTLKALPMLHEYLLEMLADWKGAGMAQGKSDTKGWYLANKDKMVLHPDTRRWVELRLGVIPPTTIWDIQALED